MAGVLVRRLVLSSSRLETLACSNLRSRRSAVTTATGGILSKPHRSGRYGLLKVSIFVVPFITLGAYCGKYFAEKMEELNVFVPDDDDDDD